VGQWAVYLSRWGPRCSVGLSRVGDMASRSRCPTCRNLVAAHNVQGGNSERRRKALDIRRSRVLRRAAQRLSRLLRSAMTAVLEKPWLHENQQSHPAALTKGAPGRCWNTRAGALTEPFPTGDRPMWTPISNRNPCRSHHRRHSRLAAVAQRNPASNPPGQRRRPGRRDPHDPLREVHEPPPANGDLPG
jgi:hypothetical protein